MQKALALVGVFLIASLVPVEGEEMADYHCWYCLFQDAAYAYNWCPDTDKCYTNAEADASACSNKSSNSFRVYMVDDDQLSIRTSYAIAKGVEHKKSATATSHMTVEMFNT